MTSDQLERLERAIMRMLDDLVERLIDLRDSMEDTDAESQVDDDAIDWDELEPSTIGTGEDH